MLLPEMQEELREEIVATLSFTFWLEVLALPQVFQTLTRVPSPAFLVTLLDNALPYVRKGMSGHEMGAYSEAQRIELMEQMRTILESWSPLTLPKEVVQAARSLLLAIGIWATYRWDERFGLKDGPTLEQILPWPPDEPLP
jgi:hypothetical protein